MQKDYSNIISKNTHNVKYSYTSFTGSIISLSDGSDGSSL